MAWTTPGTAVAGDVLTAAFWNTQVRDNLAEFSKMFTTWTSWTPTVSSATGTITTSTVNEAKYLKIGSIVFARFSVTITNKGTGAGSLRITLPSGINATAAERDMGVFRETAVLGFTGSITIDSSNRFILNAYDNASPIQNNYVLVGSIHYETAA